MAALRGTAPPWAALLREKNAAAEFLAAPPLPSGDAVPAAIVRVSSTGGWLSVAEREPGTLFPERCPELHVNDNSTFCMARRDYRCVDSRDADAFWQDLGEYLVNQHFAARRGRWPVGRWLSHGPTAADRQVEAEEIASSLGIPSSYADCLENDKGWIAVAARTAGPKVLRLMPCPLGCRTDEREPALLGECGHRSSVQRLVSAERARRAAQAAYFAALKLLKRSCCGRVLGCPLNREIAA